MFSNDRYDKISQFLHDDDDDHNDDAKATAILRLFSGNSRTKKDFAVHSILNSYPIYYTFWIQKCVSAKKNNNRCFEIREIFTKEYNKIMQRRPF